MKPQDTTVAVRPRFERHKTARPLRHLDETGLSAPSRMGRGTRPELELVPAVGSQASAVGSRASATAPQTSAVARETSAVARETSAVARETSAVARETSAVARETSAVARETSAVASPLSPAEARKFKKLVAPSVPIAPCHWGLLVAALLLAAASVPLVYSASTAIALDQHGGDSNVFLWKQLQNVFAGIVLMVLVSRVRTASVRGFAWGLYFAAIVGLVLTKFSPLGFSMGNVERWVKIGPLTFQFSELAKIALIGVMADYWHLSAKRAQRSLEPWLGAAVIAAIPVALTFIQPHLSAALVLAAIPFVVAYCAGVPGAHFQKILLPILVLGAVGMALCKTHSVPFLAPYQQDRIAAKLSGGGDEQGGNYQQLQGERAIERGGMGGVGLGGSLYKNGHLPAPHTDFIFAVIAEETGLWGSVLLIGLYGSIVFFCFQIGHSSRDGFQKLLCSGVGALWAIQALGNIFIVSGWGPVTGLPLPGLTYGGSGLWCALLGVGLVLGVSRAHCEEK